MNLADKIQLIVLVVLAGTLFITFLQTINQNKLLKAQLIKDTFDMYWKIYEAVSERQIAELKIMPEDYMDIKKYKDVYSQNDKMLIIYFKTLQTYEYMAFNYSLRSYKMPDPIGPQFLDKWVNYLHNMQEFKDIHAYIGDSYPIFKKYIDNKDWEKNSD